METCSNHNVRIAWIGLGWSEACTGGQCVLGWLSALQATTLAPSKQACCFAVLEAVISNCIVALGAGGADRQLALGTAGELVVVDASQTQGLGAALVLLVTDSLGISKIGLICSGASTSCCGSN